LEVGISRRDCHPCGIQHYPVEAGDALSSEHIYDYDELRKIQDDSALCADTRAKVMSLAFMATHQ
jgi:hypothetical protein